MLFGGSIGDGESLELAGESSGGVSLLGSLIGVFQSIFHNLRVMFNPGAPLIKQEENQSPSGEFFALGDEKARALYRKKLEDLKLGAISEEQLFNVFLKDVVKQSEGKKTRELLDAAEKKILGNAKGLAILIDEPNKIQQLEQKLKDNLEAARIKFNGQLGQPTANELNKIVIAFRAVLTTLKDRYKSIQDAKLTTEAEQKAYEAIQEDRIEILHWIVKAEALKEGKTLSGKKVFDLAYFNKQIAKFANLQTNAAGNVNLRGGANSENVRLIANPAEQKSMRKLFLTAHQQRLNNAHNQGIIHDARVKTHGKINDILLKVTRVINQLNALIAPAGVYTAEITRLDNIFLGSGGLAARHLTQEETLYKLSLQEKIQVITNNHRYLNGLHEGIRKDINIDPLVNIRGVAGIAGNNVNHNKETLKKAEDLYAEAIEMLQKVLPSQRAAARPHL